MDWCYYFSSKYMVYRPLFELSGDTIHEYSHKSDGMYLANLDSNYKKIWFGFSGLKSFSKYERKKIGGN